MELTLPGIALPFGLRPALAGASTPFANTEAADLVARMTVAPSAVRQAQIDTMVGALKNGATSGSDIWAKLDLLYVFAAHDEQAAHLNWKGESFTAGVGGGAPVFVADNGYFYNGSDDFLTLGWAPSDGVNYTQNSACFGGWFRKPDPQSAGSSNLGTATASSCRINPRTTSDNAGGNINSSSAFTASLGASPSGYGLVTLNRSSSTSVQVYKNGMSLGSGSTSSSARSSVPIHVGHANSAYTDNQCQAVFFGASLTAAEQADLYNALATYMSALGVSSFAEGTASTRSIATAQTFPDGASGSATGKGWTCTGLFRLADGTLLVGNHGKALSDETAYHPSIVHTNADGSAILHEWTAASLGLPEYSIQGVSYEPVGAVGTGHIWFVINSPTPTIVNLPITSWVAGTPVQHTGPADANGIAYDTTRDRLAVVRNGSSQAYLDWYAKTDFTTPVRSYPIPGTTDNDHLCYDDASDCLWLTRGANGSNGAAYKYGIATTDIYGAPYPFETVTLTGADSIEGIAFNGTTALICNDAFYHSGSSPLNQLLTFA